MRFQQDMPGRCRRKTNASADVLGPFPFARGPAYFLSTELVEALLADAWLAADLNETIASLLQLDARRRDRATARHARVSMVWEDVYTGRALTRVAAAGPGLALVENGFGNGAPSPTYSDGWGMQLAPSTLIWHPRTKLRPYRVAFAHHWLS